MNFSDLSQDYLLVIAATGSFVVGVLFARFTFRSGARKSVGEDPRNRRIRELETELRVLQRKYDEACFELKEKDQACDQSMMTIRDLNSVLVERERQVGELRKDVKGAVAKTRELRQELTERAAETIREHVRAEEAQTELEVVRAGSDAIASEYTRMQERENDATERELLADSELLDGKTART